MARFGKIFPLFLLLVLLTTCVAYAGQSAPMAADFLLAQSPASNTTAPKAVFPKLSHSFGEVFEGTRIKHDFVIENQGNAPLVIKNIRPD
ncbi:MAG: DUF1573 domain-containing protein [Desulfobacteraceae bacterium]|jgi:hypothetical protein